jgi:hypothetical protein
MSYKTLLLCIRFTIGARHVRHGRPDFSSGLVGDAPSSDFPHHYKRQLWLSRLREPSHRRSEAFHCSYVHVLCSYVCPYGRTDRERLLCHVCAYPRRVTPRTSRVRRASNVKRSQHTFIALSSCQALKFHGEKTKASATWAVFPSPVSPTSLLSSHIEGRTNYTCTGLSQGRPDSSLPVLSPYTSYLRVKAEARYLIYCDTHSLYRQTRMFGHIPPAHSSL